MNMPFDLNTSAAGEMAIRHFMIEVMYMIATALFIFALKWLSSPTTARRGVLAGEVGMLLAILGTLLHAEIITYKWIIVGLIVGAFAGIPLSWVPLTAVPQRTALSHAFGGLAAGLVGTAKYYLWVGTPEMSPFIMAVIGIEVILGFLTFTGSLMAFGKLQEILPTRPITYKNQNFINLGLLAIAIGSAGWLVINPSHAVLFPVLAALALIFGVLLIIPIGGADMPTVISLLNSYAGLSAVAMGFILDNKLLITAGALDGSSGFILSIIMIKY